jgi:D-alanine transaminase
VADPYPICYLNGEWLPLEAARVSPLDRGFLFADGVYEVVPVHRGRPYRLAAHLARLERSLAAIRLAPPLDARGWLTLVAELVRRGGEPEQLVYMQVTRGAERGRNHLIPAQVVPTVFAYSGPFPVPARETLERGLDACVLDDTRWARCDIKSIALLANVLLRQEAADRGAAEALLVRDGQLTEGSSSSVIVCREGVLATPPDSPAILPGTTRDAAFELADWLPLQVRPIARSELDGADEVWIASAGRGVLPVTRIDGRPVGSGRPGPQWSRAYAEWQRHLDRIATTPPLAS